MSVTKRHKPEQYRRTQEAIRSSRESKKIQHLVEEAAELIAVSRDRRGGWSRIEFRHDPRAAVNRPCLHRSAELLRVHQIAAEIAIIRGRPTRLSFEHIYEPQRPTPPQRPGPLETFDPSQYEDDLPPRFLADGDFGRFDPGAAGIESAILGRIWRAKEITACLEAAGQLGDLPFLDGYVIRPAWGAALYLPEIEHEPQCDLLGVANATVHHHPTCPVTLHGKGCRCRFTVTLDIGSQEWSLADDGALSALPEMPIRFGFVRRYRPGLSDWGRGLPDFSDVVRRRGLIIWDRHGVAYVPDYYQIAFAGDVAIELIPNPLPTADDNE
jgi:hypothetical protein